MSPALPVCPPTGFCRDSEEFDLAAKLADSSKLEKSDNPLDAMFKKKWGRCGRPT